MSIEQSETRGQSRLRGGVLALAAAGVLAALGVVSACSQDDGIPGAEPELEQPGEASEPSGSAVEEMGDHDPEPQRGYAGEEDLEGEIDDDLAAGDDDEVGDPYDESDWDDEPTGAAEHDAGL